MIKKIEVTQEDIDSGVRCNTCYCPVARALNRAFPGYEACVFPTKLAVQDSNGRGFKMKLPTLAEVLNSCASDEKTMPLNIRLWINAFDSSLYEVEPFKFTFIGEETIFD